MTPSACARANSTAPKCSLNATSCSSTSRPRCAGIKSVRRREQEPFKVRRPCGGSVVVGVQQRLAAGCEAVAAGQAARLRDLGDLRARLALGNQDPHHDGPATGLGELLDPSDFASSTTAPTTMMSATTAAMRVRIARGLRWCLLLSGRRRARCAGGGGGGGAGGSWGGHSGACSAPAGGGVGCMTSPQGAPPGRSRACRLSPRQPALALARAALALAGRLPIQALAPHRRAAPAAAPARRRRLRLDERGLRLQRARAPAPRAPAPAQRARAPAPGAGPRWHHRRATRDVVLALRGRARAPRGSVRRRLVIGRLAPRPLDPNANAPRASSRAGGRPRANPRWP